MVSSLPGMTRIYGAEFATPEPATTAQLGLGSFFTPAADPQATIPFEVI